MKCYLDSSVVLRVLFEEADPLPEWNTMREGISSRLLRLECLRAIHRAGVSGRLTPEMIAGILTDFHRLMGSVGLLPVTELLMRRAEQPFAVAVGSLDAIHLATALAWRDRHGDDFLFATHDGHLGNVARAHGFTVIGC